MRKQETLDTIWEMSDEMWAQIQPIILEFALPKSRGRKRANPRQSRHVGTFFDCGAGASGINCQKCWGTIAPSTALFSGG